MPTYNNQSPRLNRFRADVQNARAPTVAELWLKGYSQKRIAEQVGCTVRNVAKILAKAREAWLERKNIALSDAIAEQIRRVDLVESEAWIAYEKSKDDQVEHRVTMKKSGVERAKITTKSVGDAKFLDVALKCIQQRCLLLGVFKPPEERAELAVWGVTVVVDTPEQAEQILAYEQFQSMVVDGSSKAIEEQPSEALPVEPINGDSTG